jgi:TetR/AcrR family transcriptional regulator, transcriptional repressor of bet genes
MTPAPVDHDERRAELTRVLLELVADQGLEGASVRAIAGRAGVSIGTVQHYFASKDEMLQHAYRAVGKDLGDRAEERASRAPSPRAAIREVLLELLPLDARRTAALRVGVAFAARALHAPELAAELRGDLAELQDAIAAAFAEAGAADPVLEAVMALAMVSGLSEPLLFGDGTLTPRDAVAALDAHLDRALPEVAAVLQDVGRPPDHRGEGRMSEEDRPYAGPGRETSPREMPDDHDDVNEFVEDVDKDVPDEHLERRVAETFENRAEQKPD